MWDVDDMAYLLFNTAHRDATEANVFPIAFSEALWNPSQISKQENVILVTYNIHIKLCDVVRLTVHKFNGAFA